MTNGFGIPTLRVLRAIDRYIQRNHYAPSSRDLVTETQVKSTSSVDYHLKILFAAGLIEKSPYIARSLAVTAAGKKMLDDVSTGRK